MSNFWSLVFEIMPSIIINCKTVSKRSHTFITVIAQIMIFSLNLSTSNENFETIKYSLGRFFQKE